MRERVIDNDRIDINYEEDYFKRSGCGSIIAIAAVVVIGLILGILFL